MASTASTSPKSYSPTSEGVKDHSCVICYDRKVKCDRQVPCTNCRKSSSQCVYRPPPPPKRGKRKRLDEEDVNAKCRRYEDLLRQAGIPFETPIKGLVNFSPPGALTVAGGSLANNDGQTPTKQLTTPAPRIGTLVAEETESKKGRSRYVQNALWDSVNRALRKDEELASSDEDEDKEEDTGGIAGATSLIDNSTATSLLIGLSPSSDSYSLHPSSNHVAILWHYYQDNVNPILKITHTPSMAQLIEQAKYDQPAIPKSELALLFSIYLAVVNSLTNEECKASFAESRTILLERYRRATEISLIRARFLESPSLVALKAFVIFLFSMRQYFDHPTMWVLAGVGTRIGQRFGLYRDGTLLNLSPFETQMRRILWWHMAVLEGRSGQLSGADPGPMVHRNWDTEVPLNINDDDIDPGMTEFPKERADATDMMWVHAMCLVGQFRGKMELKRGYDAHAMIDKDKAIDDFEKYLEDKVLRFIQPNIPVHFYTSIWIRGVLSFLRVMAHHPRQREDKGAYMSQAEKDMVFKNSMKYLECDNLVLTAPSLQGFLWHVRNYVQWPVVIYVLSELRERIRGEEAERAWKMIGDIFVLRPEIATDTKIGIHAAARHLTIRAWMVREEKLKANGNGFDIAQRPQFIQNLLSRREKSAARRASSLVQEKELSTPIEGSEGEASSYQETLPFPDFEADNWNMGDPINWSDWDQLLQDSMIPSFPTFPINEINGN